MPHISTPCQPGAAPAPSPHPAAATGLLILMVEDECAIREPCAQYLEDAGFRIVQAEDGAAALRLLREGLTPALIILDLMMPNMNGWEFRRAQIEDARLAALPVVVMSGAQQLAPDPAMRGIRGRIGKPVHLKDLLSAVELHTG